MLVIKAFIDSNMFHMVICSIDDILITGHSGEAHFTHLEEVHVLKRLKENGVLVKRQKCDFLQNSVNYMGFTRSVHKEFNPWVEFLVSLIM